MNQYNQTNLLLAKLKQSSIKKEALDLSGLTSTIVNHVKSIYNPEKPVGSMLDFVGPSVLFRVGGWKLMILYELFGALGFDWTNFFESIKNLISELFQSSKEGKTITEEDLNKSIQDKIQSHLSDDADLEKLKQIEEKANKLAGRDKDLIMKLAYGRNYSSMFSSRRNNLTGLFVRVFAWLITTVLLAFGIKIGEAGAKYLMKNKENSQTEESDIKQLPVNNPNAKLTINPNINSEYLTVHTNNDSSIWFEPFSISNIENELVDWTIDIYPQLKGKESLIKSSSLFNKVVNLFKSRNKNTESVGVVAVPKMFKKKIDIVNSFAAEISQSIS